MLHNKKHNTYKDIGELRLHDEFHTTRQHKFVPRQFSLPSHQDTSKEKNIDQGTTTIFNTGWTIHSTSCTPSILRNTRRRQTRDSTTTQPGSNGTNPGTEIPHTFQQNNVCSVVNLLRYDNRLFPPYTQDSQEKDSTSPTTPTPNTPHRQNPITIQDDRYQQADTNNSRRRGQH